LSWYEAAFRSEYLRVYRHRDDESAAREVAFLLDVTEIRSGDRVLDLACGAGRHARPLAAAGCRVASLDLSADLLREAHDRGTPGLVRADMRRVPLLSGSFAAAASLFTSFGYFPSEEEDRAVLAEVARVLAPGGRYLLDVMNRERTLTDLVPRSVDPDRGIRPDPGALVRREAGTDREVGDAPATGLRHPRRQLRGIGARLPSPGDRGAADRLRSDAAPPIR
jgi:SAM-dependent methyltransferase